MLQALAVQDPAHATAVQIDEGHVAKVIKALAGPGWCVIPNYLTRGEWKPLAVEAKKLHAAGEFRLARVGRGDGAKVRPDVRTDRVRWIDSQKATGLQQDYLERAEAMRQAINSKQTMGLFDFEAHYALYPPGCFYRKHLDRFADAKHRTVSYIQYLNSDWKAEDGGDLRIYLPNAKTAEKYLDIQPMGGTAVFFLSGEFEHMVMPSRRERLSLTGWFCNRR